MTRFLVLPLLVPVLLIAAACGNDDDDDTTPPSDGVIVTFLVAGSEEYRILLTDEDDIAIAERLLASEEAPTIPNGRVIRNDPGVNTGYSWHIDPDDIEFAEVTMEVCDGLPSHVEEEIVTSDRYCPWSAEVIAIDPA